MIWTDSWIGLVELEPLDVACTVAVLRGSGRGLCSAGSVLDFFEASESFGTAFSPLCRGFVPSDGRPSTWSSFLLAIVVVCRLLHGIA